MRLLKQKMIFAMIVMLSFTTQIMAQVTIGYDGAPKAFALLELSTKMTKGGLRMPHLTTLQRDGLTDATFKADTEALGLTIFNITTNCIEYWNGTKWVSTCDAITPACIPVGTVTIKSPVNNVSYEQGSGNGFETVVASATNATSYEWYVNNVLQAGFTDSYFNFNTTQALGAYTVRVIAKGCDAVTTTTSITINIKAETSTCYDVTSASFVSPVAASPAVVTYVQGSGVSHTQPIIVSAGNGTFYTWTLNGATVQSSASAVYNFDTSVTPGTYTVTVKAENRSDACTSSTPLSSTATITVNIICPPIGVVNFLNPSGDVTYQQNSGISNIQTIVVSATNATNYKWTLTPTDPAGAAQVTNTANNAFSFNTSTVGKYTLKVEASTTGLNCGTVGVTSKTINITVVAAAVAQPTLPALPPVDGVGWIEGETCLDVWRTDKSAPCAPLIARWDSFKDTYTFAYTFKSTLAYSNLKFYVQDPDGLLVSPVQGSTTNPNNITFRPDIAAYIVANGAKTLTVIATYTNASGIAGRAELMITVQDCACGCPARSSLDPSGWLIFMCHNLGADTSLPPSEYNNIMSSDRYSQNTKQGTTGDLYQWGRKKDGHQYRFGGTDGTYIPGGTYGMGRVYPNGPIPATQKEGVPNKIITNAAVGGIYPSHFNWFNGLDDTLWGAAAGDKSGDPTSKGPNDPCPTGWKIPSMKQWESIISNTVPMPAGAISFATASTGPNVWSYNVQKIRSSANHSDDIFYYGVMMKVGDYLYLPLAGHSLLTAGATGIAPQADMRQINVSGITVTNPQTMGYYWSTSPGTSYGSVRALKVDLYTGATTNPPTNPIVTQGQYQRLNGYSVRCVKDN